jgi:excisionase family DNA binding protein
MMGRIMGRRERKGSLERSVGEDFGGNLDCQPLGCLLTRAELAKALKVSLSTVARMLADEEITPVRLRGKVVRFYLPDVLQELRQRAKDSKHAVARRV